MRVFSQCCLPSWQTRAVACFVCRCSQRGFRYCRPWQRTDPQRCQETNAQEDWIGQNAYSKLCARGQCNLSSWRALSTPPFICPPLLLIILTDSVNKISPPPSKFDWGKGNMFHVMYKRFWGADACLQQTLLRRGRCWSADAVEVRTLLPRGRFWSAEGVRY